MVTSLFRTAFRSLPLAACLLAAACSSDWPAFRHNTLRTGNQLNHGPLADPAKVAGLSIGWTFPVGAVNPPPGPFRAGPVVFKGVVYIGNSNGYVYAINANDGSVKWVYPPMGAAPLTSTFTCNPSSEGIASSAAMAVIGGTNAVVFGAPDRSIGTHLGSGRLFALDAKTGAEIWKSPEIGLLRDDLVTHQQIGYSSPLVFNDHVYIGLADHCDNPIQQGKVVAVKLSDGTIDGGFSFTSTGPPRGGGVWGSVAGWIDKAIYVTTGNSNIGGPSPVPNHALSLIRLNADTGSIVWGWQPVPYNLDVDPDWTATPTVMLTSCGTLAVSVQKDGWTWAVNEGSATPGPPSVKWAFPTGPWYPAGFTTADGTVHNDTRYLRPGAAWDDVYIVQTGGIPVTTDVNDGARHLYALNACTSDADRIRWIKDIPHSSGAFYSLSPPSVTHGIVFVGTDQGHLVALGDPSIYPATGWRCKNPLVSSANCVASGYTLVPDPGVIKDLDLNAGPITTEPALVGDPLFVSTEGGKVVMVKTP
jgi:outer membrane protein assembly factor BamB